MKIGFVSPDDLSTLIFCTQFGDAFGSSPDLEMVTISPVGAYSRELATLPSRHVAVEMSRFISPLEDLRFMRQLYRLFKREAFDAVITFTTKPNVFGMFAARAAGVPTRVMAVRGLGRMFEPSVTWRGRIMNGALWQLYRRAASMSHLAWFTNPVDREQFVGTGSVPAERAFLTPNGVNLRTYAMSCVDPERLVQLRRELDIRDGQLVIIMVARLIWSKGVREFADAARLVHARHPDARFLLVAPPETNSPGAVPEQWVREREAAGDIRWLGFRKDVLDLYALADLAVLPSYYNEGGYPRALLEPMALAKPVIAADTPVCRGPVAVDVNGFLVPPKDATALATAVERLLDSPELRARFGEASLRRIETEFDDRIVARAVMDRIRRAVTPANVTA